MGSLEKTEGGITFPQGFRAAGVEAHVKYPNRKDFALLVSDVPAACAGIFTTNAIAAAPVRLDRERVKGGVIRAVAVNTGIANACTGKVGEADALKMSQLVAEALGIPEAQVAVGNAGADYRSYFRMSATYDAGTGTWTVTAELDVDRVLPGGTAVLESVLTSSSDMTIQVCPGLYYAIGVSETLSDLQRPASTLATTTTLTKEKPMGARSAFFRVYVSVTPFAAE